MVNLMPEREDLKPQGRAGPQTIAKSKQERDQDGHHAKAIAVAVGHNLNVVNRNRIFVRDSSGRSPWLLYSRTRS
jgi:hypothetical protein